MSVCTYNGVRLTISKTELLSFRPIYSEDGVDQLYTEIELGITGVVNTAATATAGAGIQAGAGLAAFDDLPRGGPVADPVGTSLARLRPMLLAPRQALSYAIGGNVVFSTTGPDANNGPIPREVRVTAIHGVATALVYFRVTCWLAEFVPGGGAAANTVLANRFTVASSMDQDFWTTRTVRGQMIVHPARLAAAGLSSPDAFRAACCLPLELGFQRSSVDVTVSSDNTTLDYAFTDAETPLCLGLRSQATRIEGNCTGGSDWPVKNLKDVAKLTADMASDMASAPFAFSEGPGVALQKIGASLGNLVGSLIPTVKGNGLVRVWGQRSANKQDLLTLAVNILQDRFTPLGGGIVGIGPQPAHIVSMYCTQDLVERFIELRAEYFSPLGAVLKAAAATADQVPAALMDLSTDISAGSAAGTDGTLTGRISGANPEPPSGQGTRGNWLGAMVAALLTQPGQLPQLPFNPEGITDEDTFA